MRITVIGSLNVDITVSIPRFHLAGETIQGSNVETFTGGKGGNQAIAARRLGADVSLIACLGMDESGTAYRKKLEAEGIHVDGVTFKPGYPTGTALIEVIPDGDNRIAYVPGANQALTADAVDAQGDLLDKTDILMFQLETPMEGVLRAAKRVKEHGGIVIMDPAPAQPIPDALMALCDYITPNETELEILTGMPVETLEQAAKAATRLFDKGAGAILNKRGGQGALLVVREGAKHFASFPVKAVDTTAAGDSFNAGLAVGLSLGYSTDEAVQLANAVGALSTTAPGAQAAMPCFSDAQALIARYRDGAMH